ncbi:hypothetical protein EIP86_010159 [Pleurotus ostreatoroseus]|nr:hypothetical protein EIP86_010159 [Pleurotus ostreatoroseus]
MNSLSYLSRQFDVLAAARTPPSTPAQENAPFLALDDDNAAALKRVRTWSKPFLHEPQAGPSSGLKRSYSSPAEVYPAEAASSSSHTAHSRRPSGSVLPPPPSRRPSVSAPESPIRPKSRSESVLHRILFVRVLLSLWHYLYDIWRSLADRLVPRTGHEAAADDVSDDEKEDTEDEAAKDEKPVGIIVQEPPPIPPPICPAPLPLAASLSRSNTDSAISLLDIKPPLAPSPLASDQPPVPTDATRANELSRTPTPSSMKAKTGLHMQKTLVLDLDETLIHSTSRPLPQQGAGWLSAFSFGRRNKAAGHMVEVVLGGRSTLYHVYKRPFVDYFLRKVSAWYTLVIFTASMQEYADPVIDWLDAGRGILGRRFFREKLSSPQSCKQLPNGSYSKDLSIIEQDLSRVCLLDNSPVCYSINEANGIPIEGWINDPHDEALLDLLPVLDSLRFTNDVRRVLGIRGFVS